MFTRKYTKEENQLLLDDLIKASGKITREMFDPMEDLWLSLFGVTRTKVGLCTQMKRLAVLNKVDFVVASAPIKRKKKSLDTTPTLKKPLSPITKLSPNDLNKEKVKAIIYSEIKLAQDRICQRVNRLFMDLISENVRIKAENKDLWEYRRTIDPTHKGSILAEINERSSE